MPDKIICTFTVIKGNPETPALNELVLTFPALGAADGINQAIGTCGWTLTKIMFETEPADSVQPLIDLFKEDNDDAI